MANILDKIIEDKRIEVERRKTQTNIDQLRAQVSIMPKCRNFYSAVTKRNLRGINVIAEVKKASPSAGVIREDFDPVRIAQTYQRCGADAVSVLTDEKYFQGKLEYIQQIKRMVDIPVLRKDFIIDPWQLYESRAAGADAVLLIAEALNASQLTDLLILAGALTLTSLIEVHQADSLLRVRSMIGFPHGKYSVIGINNRDLATMQVDINTAIRLADMIDNKRELVAESGIKTSDDVQKLKAAGINAVLVGETLCASANIEEKFKELFG
jgi:indole-3-glycerol phosphate synthase